MHTRTRFGIAIVALALVVAFLQFLANELYLYWEFWWFDILMHFLGGAFIASALLWVIRYELPHLLRPFAPPFLTTLFATLAVGVLWEAFEYTTGMYASVNHPLDTTMDIAMDMAGMLFAYLAFKRYGR